jgi:hypothetical protein
MASSLVLPIMRCWRLSSECVWIKCCGEDELRGKSEMTSGSILSMRRPASSSYEISIAAFLLVNISRNRWTWVVMKGSEWSSIHLDRSCCWWDEGGREWIRKYEGGKEFGSLWEVPEWSSFGLPDVLRVEDNCWECSWILLPWFSVSLCHIWIPRILFTDPYLWWGEKYGLFISGDSEVRVDCIRISIRKICLFNRESFGDISKLIRRIWEIEKDSTAAIIEMTELSLPDKWLKSTVNSSWFGNYLLFILSI